MTETKNTKKWYDVRSVSGQENKIKNYIESEVARLNLQDYIEQVLVPTEKVIQIRNGKKISKERVYFPGYIIINANLAGEIPHIIKSINGVIGFLGETKGGDPVPLRQSEVNRMLGKVDELAIEDENLNIPFVVGETVKVIDGPEIFILTRISPVVSLYCSTSEAAGFSIIFFKKPSESISITANLAMRSSGKFSPERA